MSDSLRIARATCEAREKRVEPRSSGAPCPASTSDRAMADPPASDELGAAAAHILHSAGQLTDEWATLNERVETFLAAVAAA